MSAIRVFPPSTNQDYGSTVAPPPTSSSSGLVSPLTTKGDLWGYGPADTRVPVGTAGQLLQSTATATQGVAWATPSAGVTPTLAGHAGNTHTRWTQTSAVAAPSQVSWNVALQTFNSGGTSPHLAAATGYVDQWYTQLLQVIGTLGNWTGLGGGGSQQFWRGNIANCGGFYFMAEFALTNTSHNLRLFAGMTKLGTALTAATDPSALTDIVGFGVDTGDTNLQVICNDSVGVCTKVNLGGSFAVQATTKVAYMVALYCAPNASTIDYYARAITNAGALTETTGTMSSDLPTNTLLMMPTVQIGATTVGSPNTITINRFYVETPGY